MRHTMIHVPDVSTILRPAHVEQTFAGQTIHLIGIGGCGHVRAGRDADRPRGGRQRLRPPAPAPPSSGSPQAAPRSPSASRPRTSPPTATWWCTPRPSTSRTPSCSPPASAGSRCLKYSQMLGRLMAERSAASPSPARTARAPPRRMVAYALTAAGADPSFIVGATRRAARRAQRRGRGQHFVAEACEFDRSFLNLRPTLAADPEHRGGPPGLLQGPRRPSSRPSARSPRRCRPTACWWPTARTATSPPAVRGAACEVADLRPGRRAAPGAASNLAGRPRAGSASTVVLTAGRQFCRDRPAAAGPAQRLQRAGGHGAAAPRGPGARGRSPSSWAGFEGTQRRMTLKGQRRRRHGRGRLRPPSHRDPGDAAGHPRVSTSRGG